MTTRFQTGYRRTKETILAAAVAGRHDLGPFWPSTDPDWYAAECRNGCGLVAAINRETGAERLDPAALAAPCANDQAVRRRVAEAARDATERQAIATQLGLAKRPAPERTRPTSRSTKHRSTARQLLSLPDLDRLALDALTEREAQALRAHLNGWSDADISVILSVTHASVARIVNVATAKALTALRHAPQRTLTEIGQDAEAAASARAAAEALAITTDTTPVDAALAAAAAALTPEAALAAALQTMGVVPAPPDLGRVPGPIERSVQAAIAQHAAAEEAERFAYATALDALSAMGAETWDDDDPASYPSIEAPATPLEAAPDQDPDPDPAPEDPAPEPPPPPPGVPADPARRRVLDHDPLDGLRATVAVPAPEAAPEPARVRDPVARGRLLGRLAERDLAARRAEAISKLPPPTA